MEEEERRLSGGTGAEPGTINYHTNQISYFSGKLKKSKPMQSIQVLFKEEGSVVGRALNQALSYLSVFFTFFSWDTEKINLCNTIEC